MLILARAFVFPFLLAGCFLGVFAMSASAFNPDKDAPDPLAKAKSAMRSVQFENAIQELDTAMSGNDFKSADEALYLKSLAQFNLKQYQPSVTTADTLLESFSDSSESLWFRKARFLKARSLVALRQFKLAEEIYAEESNRLLSTARKHEIAGVIVRFADDLATVPDPADVGALPADFNKAYSLYGKALEMEIGRELRDEVMFKRAVAILKANNPGQAINEFRTYLDEFDPDWTGAFGSSNRASNRKRENPQPAGKNILSARHELILAHLRAGSPKPARVNAEDLLSILAKMPPAQRSAEIKELDASTAWLLVETYGMPSPEAAEQEKAIQVTEQFLAAHSDHRRAVEAAWFLPTAYQNFGRADEAIAGFERFIDGKHFSLPPGDAATEKIEGQTQSPAELLADLKMNAVFQIGQLRFGQKKYEEAAKTWGRYINQFPNGPHWSDCQLGIVNAQYQAAVDLVADEKYDQAQKQFETFLNKHPLDSRAAQILYVFGQIEFVAATDLESGKAPADKIAAAYQKAIDHWRRLVSKYPGSEQTSLALYQTGIIYEEKLLDHEKALDTYRRITSGSWAAPAQSRLSNMTEKSLLVMTERKFRTNETAKVKINTRNIKKLTLKQYFLDLESYFRKTHEVGCIDGLDIDLIQPDKTWEVEIEDFAKYTPFENEINIPFEKNQAGVCIVNVSTDDFEATTLVVRSDLDLIVKSSRRELLVFVQNMLTGKPARGVRLLISNGEKVLTTGTTAEDGVFQQQFEELKEAHKARVFAMIDGSVASNLLDLSGLKFSQGLAAKGYLYTDRPAYQPGQTVRFRGIVRDVDGGSYVAPAGDEYEISITDSAGRLLFEAPTKLNEFGTFHAEFQLDSAAPVGSYQLVARKKKGPTYSSTFQVQQFKLEKMKLDMESDQPVYFRGEEVELNILAAYYWGQPVAEKPIRYTLPDGRELVENTDAEGKLQIKFDTSGLQPGTILNFRASIEGQNVFATHSAMLATKGFNISVSPNRPLALAGEPVEVEIKTTAADGEPVGKDLTLFVLRRSTQPANPVLAGIPWMPCETDSALETTVFEQSISTDEKTGIVKVQLTDKALAVGGDYIVRVSGADRFEQTVTGQANFRISDDDDKTKLRLFADGSTLQVGSQTKIKLHSRVDAKFALVTFEGETIISHRVVPIKKGFNPIELAVDHVHFPNFRLSVSLMDDQQLLSAHKPFRVERKLNVVVKPIADTYAPGALGKIELTVTDQLGKPVTGELSLALVDEALFARFPDTTPDILHYFQHDAHRHAEFRETSTNGFRYEATTQAVIEAYQDEKERLVREELELQELGELSGRVDRLREHARLNLPAPAFSGGFGTGGGGFGGRMPGLLEAAPNALTSKAGLSGDFAEEDLGDKLKRDFARKENSDGLFDSEFERKDGSASSPREELPAAGWWSGNITTGDDGTAIAEIPLPESTSQWRLTARGVTVDTLVGQQTANVITRKDFFVTVKIPRSLQEGDSLQLIARVHNLTDYEGQVDLKLSVFGGEDLTALVARRTTSTEIKKQGVAEIIFEQIKTPSAAQIRFEVEATAGDLADALAQTIPVRPWGLEFADQTGGVASNSTAVKVELPEGREYQTQWMTISVGPNLQRSVFDIALADNLPALRGNRCICVPPFPEGRHAGSDLLAVARALAYAKTVDAPVDEMERLSRRTRSLISSLVVSQRDDGGWSWQAIEKNLGDSDLAASSISFWALSEARQLGFAVHDETYENSQTFLNNRFTSLPQNENDTKAVILHALSTNRAADFAHLNRLHRERNDLTSAALAYTALALANLDRQDHANEVLDVLEKKATDSNHWEGAEKNAWLNDEVETTAIAALALMKSRPASPKIAPAIEWLMKRKGVWGFTPVKAHGPASAAISEFYRRAKNATDDYSLEILVNGKVLQTINSNDTKQTVLIAVPAESVKNGENTVEFNIQGRGEFSYAVSTRGFSSDLQDPKSWRYPYVRERFYRHADLEYRGQPIGVGSTSPVKNIEIGQRIRVFADIYDSYEEKIYRVVEEPLPAGLMLVEGSLTGRFDHSVIESDRIVMYYRDGNHVRDFSYDLIGYATGDYRILPTVIRDSIHPSRMRIGKPDNLRVLPPGKKSTDPYALANTERFALGKLNFEDGRYKEALPYLAHVFEHQRQYNERDVARMLLWIYASEEFYDAQQIVNVFEVLRERFPTLEIPYDKILMVGKAYRDIGEFERAFQIHRATINASFINDSNISAVLEDEGQFLGSIQYQKNLWREYPDTADVTTAFFAISQSLFQKAPKAHELTAQSWSGLSDPLLRNGAAFDSENKEGENDESKTSSADRPTTLGLLEETVGLISEFLTLYPEDPLADDAAFSMANALLDMKQYELVIDACQGYQKRFKKSDFQSGFQYMIALGHFWQKQHGQALDAAKVVANGTSDDRDFARYIVGQIYHAENKPADAIQWYQKVATLYADAQQAIDYFQQKSVSLEEVNLFKPGEAVELNLKYRNIAEARCQVYRVDLMRLYLREKNLANVTKVNLAGIAPLVETTIKLGDGKDYIDKERKFTLDLKEEGAYLIICRGDDLFTSALALVTPLEIEVQEDEVSGRVRANVIEGQQREYVSEVHVKAIGSADSEFQSGETDLRGIFVADNLRGTATVIARSGDSRYAFYRGEKWLGAAEQQADQPQQIERSKETFDYRSNLRQQNQMLQQDVWNEYDQNRRGKSKGVEVQNAR